MCCRWPCVVGGSALERLDTLRTLRRFLWMMKKKKSETTLVLPGYESSNNDDDDDEGSEDAAVTVSTPKSDSAAETEEEHCSDADQVLASEASDEDSDCRDSQVSSGWMGKAINHYGRQERKEQKLIESLADDLKTDLAMKISSGDLPDGKVQNLLVNDAVFNQYLEYARSCFHRFGELIYSNLASAVCYLEWVEEEKAKLNDKE